MKKCRDLLEMFGNGPRLEFLQKLKECRDNHAEALKELKAKVKLECAADTNRSTHSSRDNPRLEKRKSKAVHAMLEAVPTW